MRTLTVLVLLSIVIFALSTDACAREPRRTGYRIHHDWSRDEFASDLEALPGDLVPPLFTSASVDTYLLVYYNFEVMDWQGWTRVDRTAAVDTFWHVEDYLEPELVGMPGPLEGLKSAWIGAPPGPHEYMCHWTDAPGYGNSWDESLVTDPIFFSGLLRFSYRGYFDSEPDYDKTRIEYDAGNGNWVEIAEYDGIIDTSAVHELLLSQAATKLRIHFRSDGGWSDEDGLYDSDGAAHVDELTIEDNEGLIDYEDFEGAADGAHESGIWHAEVRESYGIYAELWSNLLDDDPCNDNFSTQIAFFDVPFYPDPFAATPFCAGAGGLEAPCQNELVVSPIIDMTRYSTNRDEYQDADIPPGDLSDLGGAILGFTIYRDLPYANLVGYNWRVRNFFNGCPESWQDRGYINMGPSTEYHFETKEFGDLVYGDSIQVGFIVVDMCAVWYEVYGNCAEHTSSPYIDNVYVKRYSKAGPQWSWRDLDLFQDNFPEEEFDLESWVRADAANDLWPCCDPTIDPGDSIVVDCTSPLGGGIDTSGDGWPQVYMHVHVDYIGDPLGPKPDLYGPTLAGNYGRYSSDDGEWTILQCDYARSSAGHRAPDKYMVDMNDSLLTRGYRIVYYFKAYDMSGHSSTLPERAEEFPWPPTGYSWNRILEWQTGRYFFEWTCLPTLSSDILYVDDYHGRGIEDGIAQYYWSDAFLAVVPEPVDCYDVNSPSSRVSNGPGSRAKNYHLTTAYQKIIWDSGNLSVCTISEGTNYSDKSNDAQMLIDWMDLANHRVGLWICGDDVAADLAGAGAAPVALSLLASYCGVNFQGDSYYDLSGIVSPLVRAHESVGNPLWHTTWSDTFYAFGGCPTINAFDYLEKTGNGEYALSYPDAGGLPYYAAIYSHDINSGGYDIRTLWFGFSFMYIRPIELTIPLMRNMVVRDVIAWMENDVNSDFTDADDVPAVNALAQNFPNPFNPTTMINFGVKAKGRVTLRIYDVAGRLVRTLVDEVRDPGHYKVEWDGANNRGVDVASGVYFYRMEVPGFSATKKMVMLR